MFFFIGEQFQDSRPTDIAENLNKWEKLLKSLSSDSSDIKFMNCILKFLEHVISLVSLNNDYRKQIFESNKYFETVKVSFKVLSCHLCGQYRTVYLAFYFLAYYTIRTSEIRCF